MLLEFTWWRKKNKVLILDIIQYVMFIILLTLVYSRPVGHPGIFHQLNVILGIPDLLKSDKADRNSRLTNPLAVKTNVCYIWNIQWLN